MKFIVSSLGLLKKLQFLVGVISNNSTIPILDNFLFEIESKTLKITASDIETTVSATIEIDSENKGSIAIPSKILIDILKNLPEQPLLFNSENKNTIEISASAGKYELAFFDGNEYPKSPIIENPSVTDIPSNVLHNAISKTIFATSNDELRPMTDFVLKISKEVKENPSKTGYQSGYRALENLNKISNYASFLKQPLTLGMFVPCDDNGNIMPRPHSAWDNSIEEYDKAEERVLFEGFELDNRKSNKDKFWITNTDRVLFYSNGKFEMFINNIPKIEDIISYNLKLSESAIKQIGL